ncbi:MAG: Serine/threonine kinase, partial [bacterium]|nr:Serine/threonine kinase [bacterium]
MYGRTLTATSPAATESLDVLDRLAALGRYVVLERLGSGGMGVVYSAYDPELDRKVAIKVLRPDSQIDQSRLRREAQAMARLQHPNVIAVYDVGMFHGRVFVAMELAEGTTLADWIDERPRSWREIVERLSQAGRGLAAAHAVGLVHRDFKLGNVLVGADGRTRVGDFGLARALAAHDELAAPTDAALPTSLSPPLHEPLTRSGALLGTPSYMSPEQLQKRPADARSDQFSFCVALYRALYGTRPFTGDDFAEIADAVTNGRLAPPPKDS